MEIQLSDYIAAGSLFVALVALVKSFLSDRKMKKLDVLLKEQELQQHKLDKEERRKADVEVQVIETAPKKMNLLRFYNKGMATACNVSFSIPSDDENEIALNMSNDYLPYPKLISYQSFEIPFYNNSRKPHQTILITWDDDYAKGRSKEMVLDI